MSDADFIAIVGASCQFPGARDVDCYASLLRDGRHAFSTVTAATAERVRVRGIDPARSDWVGVNAALDDVEAFDAGLFGYTRREAEVMDPQQRLALRCAYAALDDAAIRPSSVDHAVGVYVATSPSTFLLEQLGSASLRRELGVDALALGNHGDFVATSISYRLDLRGPSMGIQTACSGSLVAVQSACEALVSGACDLALAGGVSVRMPQHTGYHAPPGGVASPSGRCRPFSDDADGTVFASGAGMLVLQRLDDARAMDSRILGVIRGWAVNNDGLGRAGFAAPSPAGQAAVVAEAIAAAGLDAADVCYVEAHGTGTYVGDEIELRALTDVFARGERSQPLIVGSCKGNIGHTDVAAGIAGLLKVLLAFREERIYPTLGKGLCASARHVDGVLAIPRDAVPWPGGVRRAGVSSFGIGGTNAHLIVEAPPAPSGPKPGGDHPQWLSLSAVTAEACVRHARELAGWLERERNARLVDVAFTLSVGREVHRHRIEVVASSMAEAAAALRAASPTLAAPRPTIAFLVPDRDDAVETMTRRLIEDSDLFAQAYRRVLLRSGVEWPGEDSADAGRATFVFCLALASTLSQVGVEPSVVMGYGLGEAGAAVMAGALSHEGAMALLRHAAPEWRATHSSRSIVVSLSSVAIAAILPDGAVVTGIDGPSTTVVSGDDPGMDELVALLEGLAIPWSPRPSPLPLFPPEAALLRGESGPLPFTWISSLGVASVEAGDSAPAGRWQTAAGHPVDWFEATGRLRALADGQADPLLVIDLGPSGRLGGTIGRDAIYAAGTGGHWLLSLLGALHGAGVAIDTRRLWDESDARRIVLPPYPFDMTAYRPPVLRDPTPSSGREISTRVLAWRREQRPAMVPPTVLTSRRWLVLSRGRGDALVERLRAMGCEVTVAEAADRYETTGPDHVLVRPHVVGDFIDMLHGKAFSDVVHRWSVGAEGDDERRLGVVGTVNLMRALSRVPGPGRRRVLLMTERALDPLGSTPVIAYRAALGALARVAAQEMPQLASRHVDSDDASVMEAACADVAWPAVAFRRGHPFTPAYAPLARDVQTGSSLLRHGGTYLITGGTGRFGTIVGGWLASSYGATVVALVRGKSTVSPMPSECDIEIADVTRRDDVLRAFETVREKHGRIDGVIHAAGSISTQLHRPIAELDDEVLAEEFDARVSGFLHVDEACDRESVPLRLLTASMSPILGGLGLAAYGAAHACIDAMADASPAWRAIHWEGWHRDAVAGATTIADTGNEQARRMLDDDEVREQLAAALQSAAPSRVVVTRNDLESRLAEWLPLASVASPVSGTHAPRENESARDALVRIIGSLVGREPADDDDFFDVGVNSLVVVQMLSHVRADLGVDVPLRTVFEQPSVSRLASVIDAMRAERGGPG